MRPQPLLTRTGCPNWRAGTAAVLSALVVLLGTAVGPAVSPAVADSSSYRYWSFWVGSDDGGWSYASQGPTMLRPADGKVVGFRFTRSDSAGAPDSDSRPREAADFDAVCSDDDADAAADTADASDGKRVAVVIDPGTGRDAPAGERPPKPMTVCAQLPDDGNAAEALAKDAPPLRYGSSGLLCAIAGYPSSGCGERTSGNAEDPDSSDAAESSGAADNAANGGATSDTSDTALPLVAGLGVVALLVAGTVWQTRRRRDS